MHRKLQKEMKKKDIDLTIIYNLDEIPNSNLFYFSGYTGLGALCIPKNTKPKLIVPVMEYERALRESRVSVEKTITGKMFFESVFTILNKINIKKIGLVEQDTTVSALKAIKKSFKDITIEDISNECYRIRQVKTKEEIKYIVKACRITDKIFEKILVNFNRFKTEKDVEVFLLQEILKEKCEPSFKPIVASGKNASMPHFYAKDTKLNKGFCIIDFGVKYKGYCSDMTRTIFIGNPTKKDKELYQKLLKIQEKSILSIKGGLSCNQLSKDILNMLGEDKDKLIHSAGHGLGLDIHEYPQISTKSKHLFSKNMVVAIEPGVYFPNEKGIRIEDTIVIGSKNIILTKSTKKLVVVKR